MRSLDYRPRKQDPKKEEVKESAPVTQANEPEADASPSFDESVVIS